MGMPLRDPSLRLSDTVLCFHMDTGTKDPPQHRYDKELNYHKDTGTGSKDTGTKDTTTQDTGSKHPSQRPYHKVLSLQHRTHLVTVMMHSHAHQLMAVPVNNNRVYMPHNHTKMVYIPHRNMTRGIWGDWRGHKYNMHIHIPKHALSVH